MKWMRHPEHGQMPVYDATTEESAKKAGWEVFHKSTWEERKAAEAKAVEAKAEEHQEPPRRGRPPNKVD